MDKITLRITHSAGGYIEVSASEPDADGNCDFQLESDIVSRNCGHPNHRAMVGLLSIAHDVLDSAMSKTMEKAGIREDLPYTTQDGTPTSRRFEPFTPEAIARFEECAADGSATALLMLDVAKLPEEEQDDAQDKLLDDGMLRWDVDKRTGEILGTRATAKAIEMFVCEGKLEYMANSKGVRGTRRPGGNGNWVALAEP